MNQSIDLEAAQAAISLDELKSTLSYSPATGKFTWLKTLGSRAQVGSVAGYLHCRGYRFIRLKGKRFAAHRLAFFWMTGRFPMEDIDHINGNRDDNRWENLREASRSENLENINPKPNQSGMLGVTRTRCGNWTARIMKNGKQHYLGTFYSPDDAGAAYLEAKSKLHVFQPIPRKAASH
ncbi:HNH endonuclease [Pseudomonas sp. p1(2021b)]|uniref:HNH endonuclease n=1 Tax=Pseudomonas sp. p1(2021b) TaxID=2874628 RepID=UPI003D2681E6